MLTEVDFGARDFAEIVVVDDRGYNAGSMRYLKTLSNPLDKNILLVRFANVRADSQPRWGTMSAHQMICHLSDSFRGSLGEKICQSGHEPFQTHTAEMGSAVGSASVAAWNQDTS